jgi:hypothetical protein
MVEFCEEGGASFGEEDSALPEGKQVDLGDYGEDVF